MLKPRERKREREARDRERWWRMIAAVCGGGMERRRFIHTRRQALVLWATLLGCWAAAAEAKKVHIPDELDDIADNEEDEAWKAWGKPKPKPPPPFDPPPDLSSLHPSQIQEEMLKRHMGTAMGFVKLRLDVPRSKDEITRIAEKWTKLLRTGAISAKIMAVDVNTIMFIIEDGQSIAEVKDFILEQPEAYEFKLGQQAFRRPGDPPLEVVIENMRREEGANEGLKDEL